MMKINNLITAIKRFRRPSRIVAASAMLSFVAIMTLGILLTTDGFNVGNISLGNNSTPETPVIITPALKDAPTEKPIVAVTSSKIPSVATHTQPMVTTTPSSSVNSLKPTSSSTNPSTTVSGLSNTTSYTSSNWSGYMAMSGIFSAVSASWRVPQVTGNGSTTTGDATWVGIGGVLSNDLIQVGTDNTVDVSGNVTSVIFFELLPAAAQMVSDVTVSPGDLIQASLVGSGNSWVITATDVTTSQTFRTVVSYVSNMSSAEWVQEDPSYASGQLVPLDNFGTVNISGGSVTKNGSVMNLATAGVSPITLANSSGLVLASPSGLTSDGAGFSVTRK